MMLSKQRIKVLRSYYYYGSFFTVALLAVQLKYTAGWTMDRRTWVGLLQLTQVTDIGPASTSSSSIISSNSNSGTLLKSTTTTTAATVPQKGNVEITDRVYMDVRVARTDGSTYIRDDLPDTFDNRVLFQRLKFGLYGKLTPRHVEKFLSYIVPPDDGGVDIDNPYPSYSRSTFPALDQATGLLMGGNIASLRVTDVAGSTALTYGNRVMSANLWIDPITNGRLSHTSKGLLTHRNLDLLPNFGITTRAQPSLDQTHTVFGEVLWDESTANFFRNLEDLPTYSVDRPSGLDEFDTGGGVATSVFNAQRDFMRGAAKVLGDDRVNKLYDGKLLRRMEVLQVGRL